MGPGCRVLQITSLWQKSLFLLQNRTRLNTAPTPLGPFQSGMHEFCVSLIHGRFSGRSSRVDGIEKYRCLETWRLENKGSPPLASDLSVPFFTCPGQSRHPDVPRTQMSKQINSAQTRGVCVHTRPEHLKGNRDRFPEQHG